MNRITCKHCLAEVDDNMTPLPHHEDARTWSNMVAVCGHKPDCAWVKARGYIQTVTCAECAKWHPTGKELDGEPEGECGHHGFFLAASYPACEGPPFEWNEAAAANLNAFLDSLSAPVCDGCGNPKDKHDDECPFGLIGRLVDVLADAIVWAEKYSELTAEESNIDKPTAEPEWLSRAIAAVGEAMDAL